MRFFLLLLIAAFSYCMGGINGAIIISRLVCHKDVRNYGSGNAGLTNMLRTFGAGPAALVLAVDVLKSFLAVLIGGWLLSAAGAKETGQLFAGFCLIMGHVFPMYYHFKGGKGALCGIVLMFVVDWRVGLCCMLAFLLVVIFTRYVSLGSMVAAVLSPVFLLAFSHTGLNSLLALFCGLLIVVEHAENILRLIGGTERKLTLNSSQARRKRREEEEDFY